MLATAALAAVLGGVVSPAAAAADGGGLFSAHCSACHGERGEGSADLRAPVLGGQEAAYVRRQVDHFVTGVRKPPADSPPAQAMVEVLRGLTPVELDAVAAHVASLGEPAAPAPSASAGFRGRGLFSGCMSCHGAKGEGVAALSAPRLRGQHGWYLTEQLGAFRSGVRGSDPADSYGRQMQAMAKAIASDADVAVLAAYIASLRQ